MLGMNLPINLNNAIIITNKSSKDFIVSKTKEFKYVNVKIITNLEFYKNIYLDVDKKAIVKIIELHDDVSFEYAKKIYEVLRYCDAGISDSFLKQILNELKKEDLVHHNDYFIELLKSREVYLDEVVAVPSITSFLNKNKIKYQLIKKEINLNDKKCLEFSNAYSELYYVFNEIAKLLDSGININKIALYGLDEEYRFYIDYLTSKYHFDVDFPISSGAYTSLLGKEILNILENHEVEEAYDILIKKYKDNDQTKKNIFKILNEVINYRSNIFSKEKQLKIYHDVIKDYSLVELHKKDAVKVLKNPVIDDSLFIFVINFSQDYYPVISNNQSLISTKEYIKNNIYNSEERNEISKKEILEFLSQENIQLISKKSHGSLTRNYRPSLCDEFKIEVTSGEKTLQATHYSEEALNNNYSIMLDKLNKYREKNPYMETISNYVKSSYKEYDNSFKGLDLIGNDSIIQLSYSGLNSYVNCPYSYYLEKVLFYPLKEEKDENDDTFDQVLGNFVHKVLEIRYQKKDFDFEVDFDEIRKMYNFSKKEQLLLVRIKDDVRIFCNLLSELEQSFKMDFKVETEFNPGKIYFDDKTIVNGRIDKVYVLEGEGNNKFLAVIDYKSSKKEFASKKVPYGMDLQLPIYLYLLKNDKKYKDYKIIGSFYQSFLPKDIGTLDDSTKYYKENYAQGIYTRYYERLSLIASIVGSAKLKRIEPGKEPDIKKGQIFYTDEELDALVEVVKERFKKTFESIRNNEFPIAPKTIKNDNMSDACHYCVYKDICHRKQSDYVEIKFDEEESEESED